MKARIVLETGISIELEGETPDELQQVIRDIVERRGIGPAMAEGRREPRGASNEARGGDTGPTKLRGANGASRERKGHKATSEHRYYSKEAFVARAIARIGRSATTNQIVEALEQDEDFAFTAKDPQGAVRYVIRRHPDLFARKAGLWGLTEAGQQLAEGPKEA